MTNETLFEKERERIKNSYAELDFNKTKAADNDEPYVRFDKAIRQGVSLETDTQQFLSSTGDDDKNRAGLLAEYLLILTLAEYLYYVAPVNEQNLFMLAACFEADKTFFDTMELHLEDLPAAHMALRHYNEYKTLAGDATEDILHTARKRLDIIGDASNIFLYMHDPMRCSVMARLIVATFQKSEDSEGSQDRINSLTGVLINLFMRHKNGELIDISMLIEAAAQSPSLKETLQSYSNFYSEFDEEDIATLIEELAPSNKTPLLSLSFGELVEMGEYDTAFEVFCGSVKENNPPALGMLGNMYLYGEGIEIGEQIYGKRQKDEKKAFELLSKAAKLGGGAAMLTLADMYNQGIYVQKDQIKAFKLCQQSAGLKTPYALELLGSYYYYGTGTERNLDQALQHYELAGLEDLDPTSKYEAGMAYIYCSGTSQNYKKGLKMIIAACDELKAVQEELSEKEEEFLTKAQIFLEVIDSDANKDLLKIYNELNFISATETMQQMEAAFRSAGVNKLLNRCILDSKAVLQYIGINKPQNPILILAEFHLFIAVMEFVFETESYDSFNLDTVINMFDSDMYNTLMKHEEQNPDDSASRHYAYCKILTDSFAEIAKGPFKRIDSKKTEKTVQNKQNKQKDEVQYHIYSDGIDTIIDTISFPADNNQKQQREKTQENKQVANKQPINKQAEAAPDNLPALIEKLIAQKDSNALAALGKKLIKEKDADALYIFADRLFYSVASNEIDEDFIEERYVFDLLMESKRFGNIPAMVKLGYMFSKGVMASDLDKCIAADYHIAFEYYKTAADKGNTQGIISVGLAYYFGEGVKQDFAKALTTLESVLNEFADPNGKYIVGMMYTYGAGTNPDIKKGLGLIKSAADEGDETAKRFEYLYYEATPSIHTSFDTMRNDAINAKRDTLNDLQWALSNKGSLTEAIYNFLLTKLPKGPANIVNFLAEKNLLRALLEYMRCVSEGSHSLTMYHVTYLLKLGITTRWGYPSELDGLFEEIETDDPDKEGYMACRYYQNYKTLAGDFSEAVIKSLLDKINIKSIKLDPDYLDDITRSEYELILFLASHKRLIELAVANDVNVNTIKAFRPGYLQQQIYMNLDLYYDDDEKYGAAFLELEELSDVVVDCLDMHFIKEPRLKKARAEVVDEINWIFAKGTQREIDAKLASLKSSLGEICSKFGINYTHIGNVEKFKIGPKWKDKSSLSDSELRELYDEILSRFNHEYWTVLMKDIILKDSLKDFRNMSFERFLEIEAYRHPTEYGYSNIYNSYKKADDFYSPGHNVRKILDLYVAYVDLKEANRGRTSGNTENEIEKIRKELYSVLAGHFTLLSSIDERKAELRDSAYKKWNGSNRLRWIASHYYVWPILCADQDAANVTINPKWKRGVYNEDAMRELFNDVAEQYVAIKKARKKE